jgi:hypothetical protein
MLARLKQGNRGLSLVAGGDVTGFRVIPRLLGLRPPLEGLAGDKGPIAARAMKAAGCGNPASAESLRVPRTSSDRQST